MKRVLIVGGVAGGASCAARLRRLDEGAEIVVFDRGPHVSFATCGLPYHVGGVIEEEKALLVATPQLLRDRFRIDVRTRHEVVSIDRAKRTIHVRDLESGRISDERYDALVLAPGAAPIRPPLPGIDLPGIFSVRTIADARGMREWLDGRAARSALVVGAGFIGLEIAENLARRGLAVTMVEKADQVLPPLDPEMARAVERHLVGQEVDLRLSDAVERFARDGAGRIVATTTSGARIEADVVVLSIGVRPEIGVAREAGLEIGRSGGIAVDEAMRTSDPAIWAVGDAVESVDAVTGVRQVVPLAGPANRQGRVAAESICGRGTHFRGVQGTAVVGAFGLTVAITGASEKALRKAGITDFDRVFIHPGQHASYYPGAKPIHLKVLFRRSDGRLLGAQAVGEEGVDKRIDVLAMAIQLGGSTHDLSEAELCYAPQFGAAKDPINMAGFVAENGRSGDMPAIDPAEARLVLDVREPRECARGTLPGALNIPLHSLRARLEELPRKGPIAVYCAAGQRGYYAVRMLRQHGFDARNVAGGILTQELLRAGR